MLGHELRKITGRTFGSWGVTTGWRCFLAGALRQTLIIRNQRPMARFKASWFEIKVGLRLVMVCFATPPSINAATRNAPTYSKTPKRAQTSEIQLYMWSHSCSPTSLRIHCVMTKLRAGVSCQKAFMHSAAFPRSTVRRAWFKGSLSLSRPNSWALPSWC